MLRTHYINEVGEEENEKKVCLAGWVEEIRNLGGIAFIILRDRTGRAQITAIKKENLELFKELVSLNRESVISACGICKKLIL